MFAGQEIHTENAVPMDRIMRLRGVFKVDLLSCPLIRIRRTRVTVSGPERVTNLGTILFEADNVADADPHWYQIARVDDVHSRIRRAIERAHHQMRD